MNREKLAEWAAIGCRWAVLATIVMSPTQWDICRVGGAHFTLTEPLVLFAAVCWLVRVLEQGGWWRMGWPLPWQVAVFVLPALLSIFMTDRDGTVDAVRKAVQVIEYFVVGYILYDDLLRGHPRRLRTVLYLLLGVTVAIVLLALGQFIFCREPIHGVCGTFQSRNVLGGWLAMMLPIVFGVALYATGTGLRIGLGLLLLCGLTVVLSAAALGAILGAIILIASTRGWRTFVAAALVATFWVVVVTDHIGCFKDPDTGAIQTSQQVLFRSTALYAPDGQPERRYPQWQSAVEMVLSHPWLGSGIGNYQHYVEQYTGTKPMPTGPSEPDIQNLYLVIAAEMGLPALFGFLALLLTPAFLSGTVASRHDHWRKGFVYGVTGGIAAFAVTVIWHPLLVRGIGMHLVLLLVVARLLSDWSAGQPEGERANGSTARPVDEARGAHRHHRHRRWQNVEHASGGRAAGLDRGTVGGRNG